MFFKKKFANSNIDFMIVGLGNPGIDYERTRHNAGFICIDYIAEKLGVKINKFKSKGYYTTAELNNKKVLLVKPQTFMNLSGEAVVGIGNFFKVPVEKTLVISDDISLDVGQTRIRRKGSDGGQKGLRSIIELTGSENFPRIKVGIGKKPNPEYDLASWVLSKFNSDEIKELEAVKQNVFDATKMIVNGQIDRAMNKYN